MSIARINGLPRVQPVLELGIGDSRTEDTAAKWDVAKWDQTNDRWSGMEPYWADVTCFAHEMECFTGHERTSEVWEVGTAEVVLDNRTGWADYPPTMIETYEHFLRVRPGIQVRIGVIVDGVYHGKWRGFIDEANPGYDVVLGETVTLVCIDAKGEAARGQLAKVALSAEVTSRSLTSNVATLVVAKHSAKVGDTILVALNPEDARFDGTFTVTSVSATTIGYSRPNANVAAADTGGSVAVTTTEFVHQRIGRILDEQYWPNEWRALETSGIELVATEFGQPTIDAINRASDSGGGSVYGDINGKVTYKNFGWLNWDPSDPVDGTIGNVSRATYADVPFDEDPDGSGMIVPPEGTIEMSPGLFMVPGPLDEDPNGTRLWREVVLLTPGDVCPTGWQMSFARKDFSNRVIVGRSDMDEPLPPIDDVQDRTDYGIEPFTITDLQTEQTSEMTVLANRILRARNFALAPLVAAVTLHAGTGDDVVDLLAKIDPRNPSRVLCRHKADDGRMIFNKTCYVTGIRHTFTPDSWEAQVSLDDASPWAIGVTHAEWDVDQWDEDQWAPMPAPI